MRTVWRWWRGIRKVNHKQARGLNLIKAKGILLEVVPSRDAPDLRLLPSMIGAVYRPHRKRLLKKMKVWKSFSSNSFEIVAYRGSVSFFLWSKDVGAMQRVVNGLNLLYPNCQTRWARNSLFPICDGDYVCHGAMKVPILRGIKDIRDFEIDPLNYLVGTLSKLPDRCMAKRSYPRLWGEKFLLTPGELATLVHLPSGYKGGAFVCRDFLDTPAAGGDEKEEGHSHRKRFLQGQAS